MRLSVESTDIAGLHRIGVAALRQGKIETALELLCRVAALAPFRPEVHANLATARCAAGLRQAGEQSYQTALALAPGLIGARLALAHLLASDHRLEEALAQLHGAIGSGAAPADLVTCVRGPLHQVGAGMDEAARFLRDRRADGVAQLVCRAARDCLANSRAKQFFRWTVTLDRVPETRYVARQLWQIAIRHFWPIAPWRLITHLYLRYAAYSGRCRSIFRGYTHRAPRQLTATAAAAIERQLDTALSAWERAPTLPVLHDLLVRESDRPIEHFRTTRILFCMGSGSPRRQAWDEPPAAAHGAIATDAAAFQSTARWLGLQVAGHALEAEPSIGAAAFRNQLRDMVERITPDIIFFGSNRPSDDDALNAAWARDIKARHRVKLCAMINDAHANSKHYWKFTYWRDDADKVVYYEPKLRFDAEFDRHVFLAPVICNERDMYDAGKPRDIPTSFIGSLKYSRAYWMAALSNSPVQIYTGREVGGRGLGGAPLAHDKYVDVLQRSLMCLNFGGHEAGISIVTGRTWEAINCGAMLLEETGSALDRFFVPYVHYVPFDTANDLIDKCLFFQARPELAAALARRAAAFSAQRYSSRHFWTRFLNLLDLPIDPKSA